MVDLQSSPTNGKLNGDGLFPDLKKRAGDPIAAPRFLAPATSAAALLGKAAASQTRGVVPPPPSGRMSAPPPPPPSRRLASAPRPPSPDETIELDLEPELPTSPEASAEPIEAIDDAYVDEGPTVLKQSPFTSSPFAARPPSSNANLAPPPSQARVAPPSQARLAPPPSQARVAAPSQTELPPVPMPPPSQAKLPPMPLPPPSRVSQSQPSAPPPSLPAPSSLSRPTTPMPPMPPSARSVTPPPVAVPSSRAGAAAQLIATRAATPGQQYVPPSPPPFPAVLSTQEAIAVQHQYSIPPTTLSEYPDPPRSGGSFKWVVVGLAALCMAAIAGFFALRGFADKSLAFGGTKTGSLVVNATGPKGAPVSGLKITADGTVRCESLPCKIGDLKAGTHFVEVEAPGFAKTASRAVSVGSGGEAMLAVELSPLDAPKAAEASAPPPAIAPATPIDVDQASPKAAPPAQAVATTARSTRNNEPVLSKKEKAEAKAKEKADAKKDAASTPEATGNGTLNINSIPVASVVLDGKPVGSTPLMGLSVSPGPHSVVFIHPEHGRKSSGATVKSGATSTVAVKF